METTNVDKPSTPYSIPASLKLKEGDRAKGNQGYIIGFTFKKEDIALAYSQLEKLAETVRTASDQSYNANYSIKLKKEVHVINTADDVFSMEKIYQMTCGAQNV